MIVGLDLSDELQWSPWYTFALSDLLYVNGVNQRK
jgi:hypothetical protein